MRRLPLLFLLVTATLSAQPGAARRATNVAALLAHPAFFHMRPVVVVGELKLLDTGELRLTSESLSLRIIHQGNTPEGAVEVRGEFWDLSKFSADDPRLVRLRPETKLRHRSRRRVAARRTGDGAHRVGCRAGHCHHQHRRFGTSCCIHRDISTRR